MATYLHEIIDTDQLAAEIRAGYVTERAHPEFPELRILNYADKAQFDNHWNDVTRITRGLIYNANTGEVVARSFPKFFNYGDEAHTGPLDPDALVRAYEKWDGSLGVLYQRPDGKFAIATRGSFDSEQARYANQYLLSEDDIFMGGTELEHGFTRVYEIIYPENRIVLDYGDEARLVPLGTVSIATGAYDPFFLNLKYEGTLRGLLELPPRKNAEGFVVSIGDQFVKIKYEEYLALHRIVSSLTEKEVWRQMRAGTYQEFVTALPDEFYDWAEGVFQSLSEQFETIHARAVDAFMTLNMMGHTERREQALWIQASVDRQYQGLVFSLLDDKDISDQIYRMIEPRGVANG